MTQLARLVQGEAHFLAAPGIVDSKAAGDVLGQDPHVRKTMALFDRITVALVGIGPVEARLAVSDNRFSVDELQALEAKGAVGNNCLRFFSARGEEIVDPLGFRVCRPGIGTAEKHSERGGDCRRQKKVSSYSGGVTGAMDCVLITDQFSAEILLRA